MFRPMRASAVFTDKTLPVVRDKLATDSSLEEGTCIYIYIYCHPQTDCFVLSELFSVARHAGRSKPKSKPVQLYVRLSFRPLGHQADHVG